MKGQVYASCCVRSSMTVTVVSQTVQIVSTPPAPSNGGPITVLGKPVMWSAGLLVQLLIKAEDVGTNQGPTNTHKQVWICDICHRQIQVRKQISSHPRHLPPRPEPNTYTCHTLISSTSPAQDKTHIPCIPPIYALTATTPPPDTTPALPSPSHPYILATQTTEHASQAPKQLYS